MAARRRTTGIEPLHSGRCGARAGGRCSCSPSWRASVWSKRDAKKIRKTFPTFDAAKAWRAEATVALTRGALRSPAQLTVRAAAEAWLEGVKSGAIRAKNGQTYKPSAIRSYQAALEARVLPEFGGARLSDVTRLELQRFVDRLLSEGLSESTVKNAVMPLRAIYRRALSRGEVSVNPTAAVELPASSAKRERIPSATEATRLIDTLPERDRALWATALYGGLRRGELLALRWEDVDLASGRIRVERSWDERE